MDVNNGENGGSVVSLRDKPPVKGRKKKSAAAKLVERKRRNSECGSEFGSTASLQKTSDKPSSPKTSDNTGISSKQSYDNLKNIVKGVSEDSQPDETKQARQIRNSKEELESKNGVGVAERKDHPPKPVPRRANQKSDRNPFKPGDIEGGTVVSIYETRDRTPTRRTKRDSSPSSNDNKDKPRKELDFSSNSKNISGIQGDTFSFLGPNGKPKSGLAPLDGGPSENVQLSPPIPMDIDKDIDEGKDKKQTDLNQNAPSDATVHRFRAMRMTPDRSRSEESIKNAAFSPKPPSTPRSARKNSSIKGEKRNREANSSGEEGDKETKKQNSDAMEVSDNIMSSSLSNLQVADADKMEVDQTPKPAARKEFTRKGLSIHPNVKEVKDQDEYNVNQNMHDPEMTESDELVGKAFKASVKTENVSPDKTFNTSPDKLAFEISPDKDMLSDSGRKSDSGSSSKKSDKSKKKKKNKVTPHVQKPALSALDGSDLHDTSPGKSTMGTLGSASDLQAVSEQYQQVLNQEESPAKKADLSFQSKPPFDTRPIIPEPKSNQGKLSPIQPKSQPPPLPQDMKASSLRTAYKADPSYAMTKFFGRSFSGGTEKEKNKYEALSARSLSHLSALPALPTREARDRMTQGTFLLSSTELDRYFPDRKVGLWIGSWNMAEIKIKKDCKEPLDDFLLPEVCEYVQDIYAIGTQENAMNKKEWEILLQETIGPSHVLFHSAAHGALHLAVFIKRDLIWFCTMPEDDLVQTRAVTMVKTKGAIAIGFHFFGTSFLFINCHFAPGDEKKKERLDDFVKITKNLNLPKQGSTSSPNASSSDVTTRFDNVFWMGDLNFRIEVYKGKRAVEDIVKYIEEQEHRNFEDLVTGDQLTKLIVEGSIFQGFQEGRINFRPTYKYDIGQDTFDTSSKNRIPSYTDRVLFRARKKNSVSCTHYDSPRNVKLSDHRPVFAVFEAAIQPVRGEFNHPLAAGQFDRHVYTEANRRRSMKVEVIRTLQNEKSSKMCSIQ